MTAGPEPEEPIPLEVDVAPTMLGRIARGVERARVLRARVEVAREQHRSVDVALAAIERDSTIGGGMLGGALAYRLFVFLLPLSLFLVAGIGIYADTTDTDPADVVASSGLTGLIASQVADAASSSARWAILIVTLPVLVYAAAMLYRAIAIVHAIAWHGSGRAAALSRQGFAFFGVVLAAQPAAIVVVGRIRRGDQFEGVTAMLVYGTLLSGAWLAFASLLPRADVGWKGLVPGAVLVGGGMVAVNSFNVYITSRLVEERADTYGALGIAAAVLFSLYLVGRVVVASAVLNATVEATRRRPG
jgi:uncharacterized BrkB/YihY/UPF0761 family membrane protein